MLDFLGCICYYTKVRYARIVCKHALMQEVARPDRGNFRGVCPILNRAKELGVHKETCELYVQRQSDLPSGIDCDPSNPVLYCAVKKNTARCKFCPPTN